MCQEFEKKSGKILRKGHALHHQIGQAARMRAVAEFSRARPAEVFETMYGCGADVCRKKRALPRRLHRHAMHAIGRTRRRQIDYMNLSVDIDNMKCRSLFFSLVCPRKNAILFRPDFTFLPTLPHLSR